MNSIYAYLIGSLFLVVIWLGLFIALGTAWCRPDLTDLIKKGAVLFAGLYFAIFLITFVWLFPGYVEMVWKLSDLTGVLILGVPLEELLFAAALGAMWGSIYEHITWRKLVKMK